MQCHLNCENPDKFHGRSTSTNWPSEPGFSYILAGDASPINLVKAFVPFLSFDGRPLPVTTVKVKDNARIHSLPT